MMNKSIKKVSLVFIIIAVILIIGGVGVLIYSLNNVKYTFIIDYKNTSDNDRMSVEKGTYITRPYTPYKKDNVFLYWVDEKGKIYNFDKPVTKDTRISAVYQSINEDEYNYTVTYVFSNGITKEEKVKIGTKVKRVPCDDSNFYEWYLGNDMFDFKTPITEDTYLMCRYE